MANPKLSNEQRWRKAACDILVGRKIVAVRYLSHDEAEKMGWEARGIVLQLDNGLLIYPSQDDEGNGPGALFLDDEKLPVIPVIYGEG